MQAIYQTSEKSPVANSLGEYEDYIQFDWESGISSSENILNYAVGVLPTEKDPNYHPLEKQDDVGKEVIIKFRINSSSKSTLYTDMNSFDFKARDRTDIRPAEPIASRYFPMTSQSYLQFEDGKCFSVISDRSLGVASLNGHGDLDFSGNLVENYSELEIMLHRRTLKDDWKGMGEAMNDTDIITGSLYINFGDCPSKVDLKRREKQVTYSPQLRWVQDQKVNKFRSTTLVKSKNLGNGFTLVKQEFPHNIHVLSLARDNHESEILGLRLENLDGNPTVLNLLDHLNFENEPTSAELVLLSGTVNQGEIVNLSEIVIPGNDIVTLRIHF